MVPEGDLGPESDGQPGLLAEPAPVGPIETESTPESQDTAAVGGEREGGRSSWRSGLLGWVALLGELVAAAVLGVLIWYAFSLLWQLYPYVAAIAAPLVLAGVVTAGQLLRRRRSKESLGSAAIAALLLVAAFLVVLPAAAVLARS